MARAEGAKHAKLLLCVHLLVVRRAVVPVEHNNEAKDNRKEGGTNDPRAQEPYRRLNQKWELQQKDVRLRKKRYSNGEEMYQNTNTSGYALFKSNMLKATDRKQAKDTTNSERDSSKSSSSLG